MTIDVAELRAKCPTCRKTVEVRRHGKTLRMRAHERSSSYSYRAAERPCPVRDVDALPAVREWIEEQRADASRAVTVGVTRRLDLLADIAALDARTVRANATLERMATLAAMIGGAS